MWYVAFTLGLFGSAHCIGMCGPLALTFCTDKDSSTLQSMMTGVGYNMGRVITYVLLGIIFGLFGSILNLLRLQSALSIVLGIIFVLSFVYSWGIDAQLNRFLLIKRMQEHARQLVHLLMQQGKDHNILLIGMANGLLPCGLVYLAIAGSITTGNTLGGMLFMLLFGLGTIPALLMLTTSARFISLSVRNRFRRILPYIQLFFGIYLIYRGTFAEPIDPMTFWDIISDTTHSDY